MTGFLDASDDWWLALRSAAALVVADGIDPEDFTGLRSRLSAQGFAPEVVSKALGWLEKASLSENFMDALGMLGPHPAGLRTRHVNEDVCVDARLREAIDRCRDYLLITPDAAEGMVEWLRAIDTRDWDDTDIELFLQDLASACARLHPGVRTGQLKNGRFRMSFH